MDKEMMSYSIPDWDTFINGPVNTSDKLMLIIAMGMLSDLVPDTEDKQIWHNLRLMAKETVETLNDAL